MGPPYGMLPIQASHIISLGILDGEWCGKLVWVRGPMSLGVPENPTDFEPVLL